MLAALGYRYGTDEATDFLKKYIPGLAAYRSSVNMAKNVELSRFMMPERATTLHQSFERADRLYKIWLSMGAEYCCLTIAPTGQLAS